MAYAKVAAVSRVGEAISITLVSDLKIEEAFEPENFTVSFSRKDYLVWKEDNPTKSFADFLTEKVKQGYAELQKYVAMTTKLYGKEYKW